MEMVLVIYLPAAIPLWRYPVTAECSENRYCNPILATTGHLAPNQVNTRKLQVWLCSVEYDYRNCVFSHVFTDIIVAIEMVNMICVSALI